MKRRETEKIEREREFKQRKRDGKQAQCKNKHRVQIERKYTEKRN